MGNRRIAVLSQLKTGGNQDNVNLNPWIVLLSTVLWGPWGATSSQSAPLVTNPARGKEVTTDDKRLLEVRS